MATSTATRKTTANKNSSKPSKKKKEVVSVPSQPITPDPAPVPSAESPKKRSMANNTTIVLDPKNIESADSWLEEFRKRTENPTKGYAQHWNKFGFLADSIHGRMNVQGLGRSIVLLGDSLASLAMDGDKDADSMIDFCSAFLKGRVEARRKLKNAQILAEAQRILDASKK